MNIKITEEALDNFISSLALDSTGASDASISAKAFTSETSLSNATYNESNAAVVHASTSKTDWNDALRLEFMALIRKKIARRLSDTEEIRLGEIQRIRFQRHSLDGTRELITLNKKKEAFDQILKYMNVYFNE